jgi:uncharacterized protein with FMN-binding domain
MERNQTPFPGGTMLRKGLCVAALIALCAAPSVFAGGKADAGKPTYADGSYIGKAEGHGGEMTVTVVVKGKKIVSIDVKANDTAGISDAAIEQIPAAIIKKQSTDVDVVSGASETSESIKEAVAAASRTRSPTRLQDRQSRRRRHRRRQRGTGGGHRSFRGRRQGRPDRKDVHARRNSIRSGGAYNAADPVRPEGPGHRGLHPKHYEQTLAGGDFKGDPELSSKPSPKAPPKASRGSKAWA